jgi:uncharacterized protein (UPF0276 family)
VAELFHRAVLRFGEKPTFLERDENLPHDLTSLTEELMSIIGVKK